MSHATNTETANLWQPSLWRYRAQQTIRQWDLTPLQLTAVYLALGFAALYFSDVLLVRMIDDPAQLAQLQALKGGLEILATGGLFFALAHRSRRALHRTNEQLSRQQEELAVLHRVLRHNLRNDVNVVEGFGRQLQPKLDDPRTREWCEHIIDAATRINHYTEQAQKINRVTENQPVTNVDLSTVANEVVERNRSLCPAARIDLDAPASSPVRAHPMLSTVLEELILNAIEHSDQEEPHIELTVDPEAGPPHETEVMVADDGPGISASVREAVQGSGETPLNHLDGLGLWFVSWVVSVSEGRLEIEPREPRGTRVRLRLPKAVSESNPIASAIGNSEAPG